MRYLCHGVQLPGRILRVRYCLCHMPCKHIFERRRGDLVHRLSAQYCYNFVWCLRPRAVRVCGGLLWPWWKRLVHRLLCQLILVQPGQCVVLVLPIQQLHLREWRVLSVPMHLPRWLLRASGRAVRSMRERHIRLERRQRQLQRVSCEHCDTFNWLEQHHPVCLCGRLQRPRGRPVQRLRRQLLRRVAQERELHAMPEQHHNNEHGVQL